MPEISSEVANKVQSEIDRIICEKPEFREIGLRRREEVKVITKKYRDNPPDAIWHQVVLPDSTPRIAQQIAQMTRVFFYSIEQMVFLSCDNPVFFFESMGIGDPNSELSVPINGDVVLWATNRKDLTPGYYLATNSLIKEFNRRTLSNSTRFVFSGTDQAGIENFVFKSSWQLNKIL
jgi:hypothetical protein